MTTRHHALGLATLTSLTAVASVACTSPEKREAASLIAAVERFQREDNTQRPAAAPAVAAVSCSGELAATCLACAAATSSTSRALLLKAEVEARLAEYKSGRADRDSLASEHLEEKLQEASSLLEAGREKMVACEEGIATMKRRHGL